MQLFPQRHPFLQPPELALDAPPYAGSLDGGIALAASIIAPTRTANTLTRFPIIPSSSSSESSSRGGF